MAINGLPPYNNVLTQALTILMDGIEIFFKMVKVHWLSNIRGGTIMQTFVFWRTLRRRALRR